MSVSVGRGSRMAICFVKVFVKVIVGVFVEIVIRKKVMEEKRLIVMHDESVVVA